MFRHFSAMRSQFRADGSMRNGTSAKRGTGVVNSRAAMIDPKRRHTSDAPSLAPIRARTTKQMSSHRPYRAYSQACSHCARATHDTARSYTGSTLSLGTINNWKFDGRDRGLRSILAAGVFEIVGVERPAPA